jgi:hypothetical protein
MDRNNILDEVTLKAYSQEKKSTLHYAPSREGNGDLYGNDESSSVNGHMKHFDISEHCKRAITCDVLCKVLDNEFSQE